MNRPALPYGSTASPETILNRKADGFEEKLLQFTEEKEVIVESRSSVVSGGGSPDRESLLRRPLPDPTASIMTTSTHSTYSDSGERIHHVEIKRVEKLEQTGHMVPDLNHIIAGLLIIFHENFL